MSSSPRQSLIARREPVRCEPQPFPYDSIPARTAAQGTTIDGSDIEIVAAREAEFRAQARQEGQAEAARIFEERLDRERASLVAALAQFTRDRATYFQTVEAEVVQLALSITRKILHREAQLDPLLLAGIVRIALEKIDRASGVTLRIHPRDAAEWRRYLAIELDPSDLPQIVEDPSQPLDGCLLETAMGTAVLGVEVQLQEIEKGFMDLLAARPGAQA